MSKYLKRLKFMLKFWKFIPFLKDYFFSNEVQLHKKMIGVLFLVAYALFPFDLIPDFLTFFGVVDDLVIATFVLNRLIKLAPETIKQKHGLVEL